MRLCFPAAIVAAVFLAACSSGTSPTPTAAALAHKIPGCTVYSWPSEGLAVQVAACNMPGAVDNGAQYVIATFSSATDEAQWIANGGSEGAGAAAPGSLCCVKGDGWAAAESPNPQPYGFGPVLKALGGQQVSG